LFDPPTAARIITSIRLGNFVETAAAAAGISKPTLLKWLKAGRRARRRARKIAGGVPDLAPLTPMEVGLAKFSDDFGRASAEAEEMKSNLITAAGKKDWRAAAWQLERMMPDKYARREKVEHSSPGGGPLLPGAAAVLFLPPNGRDVEADGKPSKVGKEQPPPPDSPPPAPPLDEGEDEELGDVEAAAAPPEDPPA
jgi:hypothetical protein